VKAKFDIKIESTKTVVKNLMHSPDCGHETIIGLGNYYKQLDRMNIGWENITTLEEDVKAERG
jgi:hypothetical protein